MLAPFASSQTRRNVKWVCFGRIGIDDRGAWARHKIDADREIDAKSPGAREP